MFTFVCLSVCAIVLPVIAFTAKKKFGKIKDNEFHLGVQSLQARMTTEDPYYQDGLNEIESFIDGDSYSICGMCGHSYKLTEYIRLICKESRLDPHMLNRCEKCLKGTKVTLF